MQSKYLKKKLLLQITKKKVLHFNSRCNIWHGSYASGSLFTFFAPTHIKLFPFLSPRYTPSRWAKPGKLFFVVVLFYPFPSFQLLFMLCLHHPLPSGCHFPRHLCRLGNDLWLPFAVLDFLPSLPSFAEINCCSFFFLLQSFNETKSVHSGNSEAS